MAVGVAVVELAVAVVEVEVAVEVAVAVEVPASAKRSVVLVKLELSALGGALVPLAMRSAAVAYRSLAGGSAFRALVGVFAGVVVALTGLL